MTIVEVTTKVPVPADYPFSISISSILGVAQGDITIVNSIGLFETKMYVLGMHSRHSRGKTSSFKRCLFIKDIGD